MTALTATSAQKNATLVNGMATPEKTSSGKIKKPLNAVPNANSAKVVYERMRKSHAKRALTFARIQGMIDGNPPYSRQTVQRGGLQTQSNINWRDGEAISDSISLAYWSLFNDVQFIAEFITNIGDPAQNPVLAETVAEEFNRILREWEQFDALMSQHQKDLCIFGTSFMFWPRNDDWRWDVGDVWRTLVPEKSRNLTSLVNIIAVEHVMSAQELWDIAENYDGDLWNRDVIMDILWQSGTWGKKNKYSRQEVQDFQTRLRNGDLSLDEIYNDDLLLVMIFIRESDGKISRGIFHPELTAMELNASKWMFFADRQFDEMCDAALLFSFTPGERYVHGNKGIGHRIFNTIEGVTQIDNSVMDSIRRAATILVRSRASRGKDPKQIQFNYGGIVDIGEADFVQNLMGANLASSIEGARYFRYKVDSNNNISGANMSTPDGKPQTLGAMQMQVTKEARVQKNRIAHYYGQLDIFLRTVVRKMLKNPKDELAALWIKRCVQRGVPEEFFKLTKENVGQNGLPEHMQVRATRASGSGSQFADQVEMQSVMSVLPTFGERGRQAALRDYIAANRGFRYIDRYLPPEDQTQQPTGEDTIASIENNQLEKGEMVVVSPDNNHAIHAPRHMQRLQQLAKSFNDAEEQAREAGSQTPEVDAGQHGQYSLEDIDIAFQTCGPHFVRHLLYLQQDSTRASLAQSLAAQWAILANYGDKIAHNAQAARAKKLRDMQQQQEQMNSMDMEERVKMRAVEMDANIKMAKLKADIQRSATRDQLQYLMQRQKVSFENELKRAETVSKIARDAAQAATQSGPPAAQEASTQAEVTGKEPTALF